MKHISFNKTRLAATISLLLGAGLAPASFAQETEETAKTAGDVEIIQVKGIRGSLARAMDMKREAIGVVDAISAEEMGKFPDTNLAESLQRITGVTVSRSNGEGSEITVRGFGPSFNLVTLNGRQMPGTGNTRSYSLDNLSSEGVSALEVIKTARAENPSGGIGAVVNIMTTKPLDAPGLKYSVSAKGIYDSSNVEGDDVTPELAALYSNTFADDTFGVALSLSFQGRDFQQQSANVPGWQADQGLGSATGDDAIDMRAENADGEKLGHTYFPRQISYNMADVQRTRANGQLTLQYAPTEDMTFSLDYTQSEAETEVAGRGFGIWFNFGGNIANYQLDENGTAINFTETAADFAHSADIGTFLVESESVGFNFDWQATDDIHIELDYHDSSSNVDTGANDAGYSGNMILAPANIVTKTYDYSDGEIPDFAITWPNGALEADPNDFDPLFGQFSRDKGESTIKQLQLHSEWVNPYDSISFLSNVKFGAAKTEQTFGGSSIGSGNLGPNGYNGNQAIFPDSMFTRKDTGDFLDQFDGGGNDLTTNYFYHFDFTEAVARMTDYFDSVPADPFSSDLASTNSGGVTEETTSVYLQSALYFEIADMPIDINFGVRYEETDVTSDVIQRVEDMIVWSNPTEWQLRFVPGGAQPVNFSGKYDVTLPTMDIKVEVTDDIVARLSMGKTITRAPLGHLVGIRSLSGSPKPGGRNGSQGNTGLLPFESSNIDLSVEYYYDEASYVSLGYFKKDVKNFITISSETIEVEGLRDPLIGPRATQAISDLVAASGDPSHVPTDGDVWTQIIANGGGAFDELTGNDIVFQNSNDPLMKWLVSQPTNGDDRSVDGIEFAVQHMFGDSGFGSAFNFTAVDGDVQFDVSSFEPQAPLNGLSDSANFQVFYEKDGLSVKVTYAWRDDFLLGVGQAQGSAEAPPQFAKAYSQTDLSVNYDVDENLTVFFEGLNITNSTEQGYGRYVEQFLYARQYGPRYTLGARYTF
ncbi:TonB-dependent receptor [Alteromonadaceae bacterium BrNp21-10]|nr:TonB-dependent receptor [Alteromonadaceae bacterium BrNp21-10]